MPPSLEISRLLLAIIREGSPPFPLFLSLFNVLGRENRFARGRRIKRGNERKWIFERTFPEEEEEKKEKKEEGNLSWRKGYEP